MPRVSFGTGQDQAVTISSNTDLGTDNLKMYKALTVNATFTLEANSIFRVFVRKTLNLAGTISVKTDQAGGAAVGQSGKGGDSGGVLIVTATTVNGAGELKANGEAGGNGTSTTSGAGAAGNDGLVASTPGLSGAVAAEGGNTSVGVVADGGVGFALDGVVRKYRAYLSLASSGLFDAKTGSGGSGADAGRASTGTAQGGDGGGGGAYVEDGGDGGLGARAGGQSGGADDQGGSGGGGGGSGGVVVLVTYAPRKIDIEIKGGNGGNGGNGVGTTAGAHGGGGGGGAGGGYAAVIALSLPLYDGTSGQVVFDGGTGGTGGTASGNGTNGDNGSNGGKGHFSHFDIGS